MQNFGDATLVSTNAVDEYDKEKEKEENAMVSNDNLVDEEENLDEIENNLDDETKTDVTKTDVTKTSVEVQDDTYFTTSKLERENMYSQMLESYQQIYNNSETSADQKTSALAEIAKINKIKNAIMIAENLISAKGFEKVVLFVNDNSVSVIVGESELAPEQIAQIQNIVSRELNVDAGIIHISTK